MRKILNIKWLLSLRIFFVKKHRSLRSKHKVLKNQKHFPDGKDVLRRIFYLGIIICIALSNKNAAADETLVPRTIIALYDGSLSDADASNTHTLVEMPLNHLGLKVEYYDVQKPLPDISKRSDVRGVLAWFFFDTKMQNPEAYLKWASDCVNSGKKYVILGTLGVMGGKRKPPLALVNSFVGKLGMKMTNGWTETAFDVEYLYNDPEIFLTKEPFEWNRSSYETVTSIDSHNIVHLAAHHGNNSEENSDLVITGDNGGYISSGYIIKTDIIGGVITRQWVINPFDFFRTTFDTDDLPKPDTTTIAGRRIYYSHIDGDGFNSITQLEEYKDKQILSADVVMEKAVKPYPDLPVTLTAIAGDIDLKWAARDNSRDVAKEFFALPQVEAGTHTYSHPFNWEFFADGDIRKEAPYLRLYPQNSKQPVWNADSITHNKSSIISKFFKDKMDAKAMPDGNARPRAFAQEPFNIKKEVQGSINAINELLPKDKKVELITWSGDCMPWEEAVHQSRIAGVQNINGGDTLFDAKHPNYATVAGVGRQVGKELQIYASTSNEIPYTNEWTENFDAHRHLQETLKNTESPIRLKPLNIYYHLYAGEKEAGLNALLSNLEYAVTQNIAPITTSHYTHIAEGFYETKILQIAKDMWSIKNRGALQTIRFDRSAFKSVDFSRSKGVIGQRNLQGSLYVYLDEAVSKPVIALKNNAKYFATPEETVPYLIESRWLISNLRSNSTNIDFTAQGFGNGECIWQVPSDGNYRIKVNGNGDKIIASKDRQLKIQVPQKAMQPLHLTITRI